MKKVISAILMGTIVGIAVCPAGVLATDSEESFEGKTLTMIMHRSENEATLGYQAQIAAFEEKYGC